MQSLASMHTLGPATLSKHTNVQPCTPAQLQRCAQRPQVRARAATVTTEANPAAALAAAAPLPADSTLQQEQIKQVCQILESSLQRPAAAPRHRWGKGLSVKGFTAALQALPMQQQLRWKSLYPAIGTGSRGKVYQAVNLETGATGSAWGRSTWFALGG